MEEEPVNETIRSSSYGGRENQENVVLWKLREECFKEEGLINQMEAAERLDLTTWKSLETLIRAASEEW